MQHELEQRPQHGDLTAFRTELDVVLANSVKAAQTHQIELAYSVNLALSERELRENQWKAAFEAALGARVTDLWAGLHATAHKLQESVEFVQTDVVQQEDTVRELSAAVARMTTTAETLAKDTRDHANELLDHAKAITQLFAQCAQIDETLATRDASAAACAAALTNRLDAADARARAASTAHETSARDVGTTLRTVCQDLATCHANVQTQHDALVSLETGAQRQQTDLSYLREQLTRSDAKLANVDTRVATGEKKTTMIANAISEQSQALQHHVDQLRAGLEQAAAERVAIKRAARDQLDAAHETQLKLDDVGRLAATTDLALARTAAEVHKVHALVATSASQLATTRQSLRDTSRQLVAHEAATHALQAAIEQETALTSVRFADAAARDDAAQQGLVAAAEATQSVKVALDDAIRHQNNVIHQLHTVVDSIAITESADNMDDKLARFALATAELGLKLEHFGRTHTKTSGKTGVQDDVKAELAVLLTKVVRFLGSMVAIDTNKYLLSVRRPGSQSADHSATSALVVELPPQHILETFRVAKASLFVTRTRTTMDQLAPVLRSNASAADFRTGFSRRLQFVLEFGLANLFPNLGRSANPDSKRTGLNVGTCIACDRPIDDDHVGHAPLDVDDSHSDARRLAAFADDVVADEHRLRRQRIVANRIDTTSVVRGRSGNSGLRPKSAAEPVHQPPGGADFVYRAGFRLPKPSNALPVKNCASAAALSLASVVACGVHPVGTDSGDLVVTDGSSLETVALTGKSQAPVAGANEGPTTVRATLPRPHTAPHRTKSLPRLEILCTTTPSVVSVVAVAPVAAITEVPSENVRT